VKILHSSDWHVGKVLKGQSRVDEHLAVLAELVEIARAEQPDLVLVAGDLFDTGAPSADATRIVTRALSALRGAAGAVVAIAGNHDNGPALDALRPWADAAGITIRGAVRTAEDHVLTGVTAGGEAWHLVALPFLSQRYAVRATEMFTLTAAEATQTYADHLARMIATLCAGFSAETVNLITAHLTVLGATTGGGERDAHTVQAYAVPATIFPTQTHYVALGHLHRRQTVPGPCPVQYSGAPLAVDFGEEENTPSVNLVEVSAAVPAKVRTVPLTRAVPLRTVRGTLAELAALPSQEQSWLRVIVREQPRAGLREEVQALLPRALEVRIDPELLPAAESAQRPARAGRSPRDLFSDYLGGRGHADPAVEQLFNRLYEEVA
jgi:exonuclease SbcD